MISAHPYLFSIIAVAGILLAWFSWRSWVNSWRSRQSLFGMVVSSSVLGIGLWKWFRIPQEGWTIYPPLSALPQDFDFQAHVLSGSELGVLSAVMVIFLFSLYQLGKVWNGG